MPQTVSSRRPLLRGIAAASGLLLGAVALSACSAADDVDLTVYSGRSETLVGPLVEKFEKFRGLDVEVRYGDSAELATLIAEERDNTPAQVFLSQDAGALELVSDEGLAAKLPSSVTGPIPAEYRAANGTWAGVTGRARVFVVNGDEVAAVDEPSTAAELTDPKWKGEIGIAPTNGSFQAFVTAMRVQEGEDVARQWLEDIVANDPEIFPNNVAILDAVDAGTISVGLVNHYYWFEKAAEVGAENLKAKLIFPRSGDVAGLVNVSGVAILKDSADDPQARAFAEYLVSAEAQTHFAQTVFEYPLIASVPAAEGLPGLDELRGPDVDLADLNSLPATLELLDEVGLT